MENVSEGLSSMEITVANLEVVSMKKVSEGLSSMEIH